MVLVTVTWNKKSFNIDVDVDSNVELFKLQLQSLTNVPSDRQKIIAPKIGQIKDDTNLEKCLKEGMKLIMYGTESADISSFSKASNDAAVATVEAEIRAKKNEKNKSLIGIKNIGNTCYLNSAIQLIQAIPQAKDISKSSKNPLCINFGRLLDQLEAGSQTVVPINFYSTFITRFPEFAKPSENLTPQQHDSQEALSSILTVLNESIEMEKLYKFRNLFNGRMKETRSLIVNTEESNENTPQPTPDVINNIDFNILSVHVTGEAQNLEFALEEELQPKKPLVIESEGIAKSYRLSSSFTSLPEFLFVQFVRFSWRKDTNNKAKILKPITFPFVLDLFRLCDDELKEKIKNERDELRKSHKPENLEAEKEKVYAAPEKLGNTNAFYELCGVITHKGRDADSGHYIAWIKDYTNQWYVYDDENVAPVKENDISRLKGVGEAHIAYILLYRSRNPETNKLPFV